MGLCLLSRKSERRFVCSRLDCWTNLNVSYLQNNEGNLARPLVKQLYMEKLFTGIALIITIPIALGISWLAGIFFVHKS